MMLRLRLFPGFLLCLLAGILNQSGSPTLREILAREKTPSLAFVTCLAGKDQEASAAMLLESIRTFGGPFQNCPIHVMLADPDHLGGEKLRSWGVKLIPVQMEPCAKGYPFAFKAYAAARIEEPMAGKVQTLIWMDPETLLLRPLGALELQGAAQAMAPESSPGNNRALAEANPWTRPAITA
jgi:hypothetical protein